MDVESELRSRKLAIDGYGILRNGSGRPRCPNDLLESVVKCKLGGSMDPETERLYGVLLMTLARIVLNNAKFKRQEDSVRAECFSEMMLAFEGAERCFDWSKGSKYYSYLFRCMYTNGIHVLEAKNKRVELQERLTESMADKYMDCGCRVGPSSSTSTSEGIRQRYVALRPGCA